MCGVLFLHGPAARERAPAALQRLAHRGPDGSEMWVKGQSALGFARLAITDTGPSGRQPYAQGSLVGAFNGEIFNHNELVSHHGLHVEGSCDTRVILPLYERIGAQIVDELDGFYSGVILQHEAGALFCIRDQIGKKPLLVGRSGTELFVTNELKAVDPVEWFRPIPGGLTRVDLRTGDVSLVKAHLPRPPGEDLRQLVRDAVVKRIPPEGQPVGLFLSGGLDSSIVAAIASQIRSDIRYYCLGDEGAPDSPYLRLVIEALGLREVRVVEPPSPQEVPRLLEEVVYASESYNPSIVSNGLCTYLLSAAARRDDVRVVLTGEGADELFCGYHWFPADGPWRATRDQLLGDMHFTELRRLDTCSMAFSVEARCPFLDRGVQSHAQSLEYESLFSESADERLNKLALRRAFAGMLPEAILNRRKTSFDVGSGVRRTVVDYLRRHGRTEREELRDVWRRRFSSDSSHPYFHSYPVFDRVIDQRGVEHR